MATERRQITQNKGAYILNSVIAIDIFLEEYEKYRHAGNYLHNGSTSLSLPEVLEEERALTFYKEELKHEIPVRGIRFEQPSDVGSSFVDIEEISFFGPSESPFDRLDEILPNREKTRQLEEVRELINFMVRESNLPFAGDLAARLYFLYETVQEDQEESPVSSESLSKFIDFLQNTPNLKHPDVVLTPSNEIAAQWRAANNRHFAVVFQATGQARFVIFTSNPKDPAKIDRLSGITSVDTLMDVAKPHGVLRWATL